MADRRSTPASAVPTVTAPLAASARSSPPTSPTAVSPLRFLIFNAPPTVPMSIRPEDATSASPSARPSRTSPSSFLRSTATASSIRIRPTEVLIRQSPNTPSSRKSPIGASASTEVPTGTSTVMSTDPVLPKIPRFFGTLTTRAPSAHETVACSASLTSSAAPGSVGRTSTRVSVRLAAAIRTEPMSNRRVARIGPGVSKEGMAVPS